MNHEIHVNNHITLALRHDEDTDIFFALTNKNREELRRWLPWVDVTLTSDDIRKFLMRCQEQFAVKEAVEFGIKYDGEWVGSVGFHTVKQAHEWAEIGYWLDADYQGKGVMTESVKALMKYGFEELQLNRIQIRCDSLNIKSKAVPERLGYTLEGVVREDHKHEGTFSDGLIYGILKREWLHNKQL